VAARVGVGWAGGDGFVVRPSGVFGGRRGSGRVAGPAGAGRPSLRTWRLGDTRAAAAGVTKAACGGTCNGHSSNPDQWAQQALRAGGSGDGTQPGGPAGPGPGADGRQRGGQDDADPHAAGAAAARRGKRQRARSRSAARERALAAAGRLRARDAPLLPVDADRRGLPLCRRGLPDLGCRHLPGAAPHVRPRSREAHGRPLARHDGEGGSDPGPGASAAADAPGPGSEPPSPSCRARGRPCASRDRGRTCGAAPGRCRHPRSGRPLRQSGRPRRSASTGRSGASRARSRPAAASARSRAADRDRARWRFPRRAAAAPAACGSASSCPPRWRPSAPGPGPAGPPG